jgi:hypothetical protein
MLLKDCKNFLWQGAQASKKWALVAWNTICKPKDKGGLGLRDPEILNQTLGPKHGGDGYKKKGNFGVVSGNTNMLSKLNKKTLFTCWKHPWAPLSGTHAWKNKRLIQQHNFWEIQNGHSTLFWEDSWQQLPPLHQDHR